PPAGAKPGCPERSAPLSESGLAGREPRTVSRPNSGRAASTIELSYRPAWQAPLRNSSVSRTAQGFFVTSGNTIRAPSARRICVTARSEEHTSELQSHLNLVCRLLLEKKN